MEIEFEDLVWAYRKAKVDLAYSNDPRREDLAEYERNLKVNLSVLRLRLLIEDTEYFHSEEFLGDYVLIPKKFEIPESSGSGFSFQSDPERRLEELRDSNDLTTAATMRLVSRASIDMHVLSALWINKVGEQFDKELLGNSLGYRLRRVDRENKAYSMWSTGSFQPYLMPYRRFGDEAISAANEGIDTHNEVVVLSTDATGYFHSVDPIFLTNAVFLEQFPALSEEAMVLHTLFADVLVAWNLRVQQLVEADFGGYREFGGLPLGLAASSVVANLALHAFDLHIVRNVKPLHYARYVDDIVIVLSAAEDRRTAEGYWALLADPEDNLVSVEHEDSSGPSTKPTTVITVAPTPGLPKEIAFGLSKTAVVHLSGERGKAIAESVISARFKNLSEWRDAPIPELGSGAIWQSFFEPTLLGGETAQTLAGLSAMELRKGKFAIALRNVEWFAHDLDPDGWKEIRTDFYNIAATVALDPVTLFQYYKYFERILGVAANCGDIDQYLRIINALAGVPQVLSSLNVNIRIGAGGLKKSVEFPYDEERFIKTSRWNSLLADLVVFHGLESHITRNEQGFAGESWTRRPDDGVKDDAEGSGPSSPYLASFDLGHSPVKSDWRSVASFLATRLPGKGQDEWISLSSNLVPRRWRERLTRLAETLQFSGDQSTLCVHRGFLFPVRPLQMAEVFQLIDHLLLVGEVAAVDDHMKALRDLTILTRGFSSRGWNVLAPASTESDGTNLYDGRRTVLVFPRKPLVDDATENRKGMRNVALISLRVEDSSFKASVHGKPDHSVQRYRQLMKIVNVLFEERERIDYAVFPELSIPRKWFERIAFKLLKADISLISGVEYDHDGGGGVVNQIHASLVHTALNFRTNAIYVQDKQLPAPGEEETLRNLRNLRLVPKRKWTVPPLLEHGGLRFAMLNCFELSDIAYRSSLRGEIDVLFVPEWNQDLTTFEALVESTALDIHAYVVQVNNRKYGDSRVRAPRKKDHERDVARVRGGINDQMVIAEIPYVELRKYQSLKKGKEDTFKPLPAGFELDSSHSRFTTP